MKKLFLLSIATLLSISLFSQTIVGTTVENKNVVLEEFTGIHCVYCPQGHAIAQGIQDAHPDDVFLINVHVGSFATPSAGEPDFRTIFGTSIVGQTGLTGYPQGTVNRHVFSGLGVSGTATAMNRGNWSNAANQILAQTSYVNVGVEAEIDVATRELTVHVEAYYTGDSPETTNLINIALLQDNTLGPQTGGNAGSNYNHMHRLVWMLTGQWGETISTTTTGTFYENTYTYTIPAAYNSIEAVLANLRIVAFVSQTHQEIVNASGCTPIFTNITTNDLIVKQVTSAPSVCGDEVTPSIKLENTTPNEITSLEIKYKINNGTEQTYNWTGSLPALHTKTITLPTITFVPAGVNTIDVEVVFTDDDLVNNSGTTTFNDAVEATTNLTLTIHTDAYPEEITWNIKNSAGTIVQQGGPYTGSANTDFTFDFTMESDCYIFNMIDSYGDGGGPVTLKDADETIIYQTNGAYSSGESTPFLFYGPPAGVFSIELTEVLVDEPIVLTFSEAVRLPNNDLITNPASLISFVKNSAKTDVPFTAEISADNTVITITPTEILDGTTSYTISLSAGSIETFQDIALDEDVEITFTTEYVNRINSEVNNIKIYPNPANDIINISNVNNATIEIYNIYGQLVLSTKNTEVNVTSLSSGTYNVKIITENGTSIQKINILR